MMRYAIFFLLASTLSLSAQERCWIYFTDKGSQAGSQLSKSLSPAQAAHQAEVSPRALARRQMRAAASALVDADDLPVAQEYLAGLASIGIQPINQSRWLNAVSALLTPEQQRRAVTLPGVRSIEPVRVFRSDSLISSHGVPSSLLRAPSRSALSIDYGPSYDQVAQIDVPRVHALGITGRGVLVGMLDSGFRWREHEALKNAHVIAEYDFIQKDSVTANQSGDSADQDNHGTKTMSTLGGYMPGELIGPAFGVSFMLAKTEYVPAELNVEEDNWVAGLEWFERSGVDVVSSSLGYSEFDAGQHSYTYADMNGRTAVTSKAASIAARKGVLVCSAMGNEAATSWHYLTSPADADSIMSVGAVTSDGTVAGFSSVGPTSDGRTKPDACARGVDDICASPSPTSQSLYVYNSGTSLSTPLVAGAAALLLSARPELSPIDVRNALRQTASNANAPNNSIGWGVIDVYKALMADGLLISASIDAVLEPDSSRMIEIRILSPSALVADSLLYHYSTDAGVYFTTGRLTLDSTIDSATQGGVYSFTLPKNATHFYLSAADVSGDARRLPFNAPVTLFDANLLSVTSLSALPTSFVLMQNYPNPFNGMTTIRYALTHTARVAISVYDILGREIAPLVNETKDAGYYSVTWNASGYSSGVYFFTIRTDGFTDTKKMILVR